MTSIKVKNKDGVVGYVATENWANPKTFLMDFADEKSGDFWPELRTDLEYLSLEEY